MDGSGKTLTLSGANTYTGGTTITAGTIKLGTGGSIGDGGLDTGTAGHFDLGGQNQTVTTLAGTGGTVTNSTADDSALTVTKTSSYGGVIEDGSGGGTVALTMDGTDGTQVLTLTGANTYTGGTTITAGTIKLGTGGSIGDGGLDTGTAGTFDLNSHDQTVTTLSGSTGSSITNSASGTGTGTLTVTDDSSYGGLIENGDTAKVALDMDGSGQTLTLSGTNTYTGGTTITAGTIKLGADGGDRRWRPRHDQCRHLRPQRPQSDGDDAQRFGRQLHHQQRLRYGAPAR